MSGDKQTQQKRGLGKGFDTLLPQNFDTSLLVEPHERIQKINITSIRPNSQQPRRHFDELALQELSDSIKQYGMLQPIVVTPEAAGEYEIVAGERRWRAAQLANLKTIPVIVRSTKELERLEIALVENVQRVDLSPLDQAVSIERLHQQFNLAYDVVAKRMNKAESTITNIVRLLQLPKEAKDALTNQQITEGHARQIVSLKAYPNKQSELLEQIITNGWSVRQAERFVTAFKSSTPNTAVSIVKKRMSSETPFTKALGKQIKAPVSVRRMAHGGKLEIGFTSEKDLSRILNIFMISKKF